MKTPRYTDYEVDSRGKEHSQDDPRYHVITATIFTMHSVEIDDVSGEICDTANLHHCLTQDEAREHLEYLVKCAKFVEYARKWQKDKMIGKLFEKVDL